MSVWIILQMAALLHRWSIFSVRMNNNNTNSIHFVSITDPPSVSLTKLYHSHMNTITMELVCRVQANPTTSPTWVFTSGQGRVVRNISREVDRVVDRMEGKEIVSVVIITSPMDTHLGQYICSASNSLGEDSRNITLQGKRGISTQL